MSFGGGYNGGRTRMGTQVILNVYDLAPTNDYLYPIGLGLHHSGVEVLGTEYTFAAEAGVFDSRPREVPNAKFRESIIMGTFEGGSSELSVAISELRDEFHGGAYNLIKRNCNHFANALCWRLLRKAIPGHVNRLADFGGCCSCLIPKKLLEESPVNSNGGGSGGGGSSGFMVKGGGGRAANSSTVTPSVFSGSGAKLGGESAATTGGFTSRFIGSASGKSSNGQNADDLTDRREKARKAALRRFEINQEPATGAAESNRQKNS